VLVPLSHFHWQTLRAALRAEAAGRPPLLGRDLRLSLVRRTRYGTFLDELVADGLLVTVGEPEPATEETAGPVQFRTRYALTDKGRHAAEYGEYDRPYVPREAPLSGAAAELEAIRAARRNAFLAGKPPKEKG